MGILAVISFGGAIAVTVVAKEHCAFMLDTPASCMEAKGVKICCKCSDLLNTKCISKFAPQELLGFGVAMIIFFWTLFAVLGASSVILFQKSKHAEERAQLLG